MDGFGIHIGFGYLVMAARPDLPRDRHRRRDRALAARDGTACWRSCSTLQVVLAWFGCAVPAIGFFHPVNALLIFVVLLWIVHDTWRAASAGQPSLRATAPRLPDVRRARREGEAASPSPSAHSGWLCAVPPVSNGVVTPT